MKGFGLAAALAAIFAGITYGSCYILGGIEAGMPGGGHNRFAEYHEGNKFTSFLKGEPVFSGWGAAADASAGEVTSNPFVAE